MKQNLWANIFLGYFKCLREEQIANTVKDNMKTQKANPNTICQFFFSFLRERERISTHKKTLFHTLNQPRIWKMLLTNYTQW